jgi:predicted Zn-dependent peptidase
MVMQYEKHTLKNGVRVILAPEDSSSTATVLILVGTGSRYETRENNGISHFLEHMFFKGTEKRPSAIDISHELDEIGGIHNAFTGKEHTGYWVKTSAKNVSIALDIISDVFLNATFKTKEINRERGAVIQEIGRFEDMPERRVGEYFETLLYGDTPLGWDIAGSRENVLNIKRMNFLAYLNRQYRSENIVVCIAGGFNKNKIFSYIQKNFSDIPSGFKRSFESVNENQKEPRIFIKKKITDQTHLVVGVRSFDMFSEKRYALTLLATVLGGGASSRMHAEIREKRGLAYWTHTFSDYYLDVGYLATYCGTGNDTFEKSLSLIIKEYRKIARNNVDTKELKKAKEYVKGRLAMGLESSDEIAMFLGDQEVLRGEIVSPDVIAKKIDRVSAKEIREVAKEIFCSNRLNLAAIGPNIDEEKTKALLKL